MNRDFYRQITLAKGSCGLPFESRVRRLAAGFKASFKFTQRVRYKARSRKAGPFLQTTPAIVGFEVHTGEEVDARLCLRSHGSSISLLDHHHHARLPGRDARKFESPLILQFLEDLLPRQFKFFHSGFNCSFSFSTLFRFVANITCDLLIRLGFGSPPATRESKLSLSEYGLGIE
jgi:hypothetical protein